MKKLNGVILFIFILFVSSQSLRAQDCFPADSIREIIKREVENKRSSCIVIGIINEKGSEVISYGTLRKNGEDKADGNTIFEIGSVSKVFTSLLLSAMEEKGELSINDPISKYLPETVKTPTWQGKEITLIDLSAQSSGLPRMPDNLFTKDYNNPYAEFSVKNLYDFLSGYKLTRAVGEKYEYSNLGVGLLGHILALKAGSDYETLLKERICKPLKMESTGITLSNEDKKRLAQAYNNLLSPVLNWDLPTLAGAGAIRSTVNDLLKFLEANLGFVKNGLSSAIEKTHLTRAATGYPEMDIAMAWHINKKNNTNIIFHNGATGGYCSFVGMDKDSKKGVVVLSNSQNIVDDIGLHILNTKFPIEAYNGKTSIADTLIKTIYSKGIDSAVSVYRILFKNYKNNYNFAENIMNNLGYQFFRAKKLKEAIEIYKLSLETYTSSSIAYEKLGEVYLSSGEKDLAVKNYSKSLELNPGNPKVSQILEKLKNN